MNVSPNEPFKVVYSLFEHPYLGCLFESFVVQVKQNKLTLKYQNISSRNAYEFDSGLSEADYELIKLMDAIQQDVILKKFSPKQKKLSIFDFIDKIYDSDKGDKTVQKVIEDYIERKKVRILELLLQNKKLVYTMQKDGTPTGSFVEIPQNPASIRFHVFKNSDNTQYYPTILFEGKKIEFRQSHATIVCNSPAWLLHKGTLYHFDKPLEGSKLRPFLHKKFILVPQKVEKTYYKKFVAPLVAAYDVHPHGFDIKEREIEPSAELHFSLSSQEQSASLFGEQNTSETGNRHILFDLKFKYGQVLYSSNSTSSDAYVSFDEENFVFDKTLRNKPFEEASKVYLKEKDLDFRKGKITTSQSAGLSWIKKNKTELENQGILLKQHQDKEGKTYFIGESTLNLEINEKQDWFDINAKVKFGEYQIPFIRLRNYILRGQREFELPNGEIAIIPEEWFVEYSELFEFAEERKEQFALKKHHLALVQDLQEGNLANVTMSRKLEKLKDFDELEDYPTPEQFLGELRPYQKAGYNWLRFLQDYHFGGCLADDMGLGKTVQTLALLQSQKEKDGEIAPSLLIMPTSLLYNWASEAKKFTPQLKVWRYTGTDRNKDILSYFHHYDIILTSYGIARIDTDILQKFYFNYVILDESQAIKNPSSSTSKAVKKLKSRFKLILTGTPIENSTMDLWSQMSFVNEGLLGNQTFFKKYYQTPIEKKADLDRSKKLHAVIKPFVLRRTKNQVATDLPPKVENVVHVEMTEKQEKAYEEAKTYYRNEILNHIENNGIAKSQIVLLKGLTKLRQLANHPKMVEPNYVGDSGKFDDVWEKLQSVISENHKVLIFSQFVKHLSIIRAELDKNQISYAYLDGSTQDRKEQVDSFQKNPDIQVFLLSLKAGGVGLNLTAADYVFILDPWWNPAIEAQAVDRAHRIGQENKVFIYKFITQDTVEEKILALQQHKLSLSSQLITTEESFVKALSQKDIESILS